MAPRGPTQEPMTVLVVTVVMEAAVTRTSWKQKEHARLMVPRDHCLPRYTGTLQRHVMHKSHLLRPLCLCTCPGDMGTQSWCLAHAPLELLQYLSA